VLITLSGYLTENHEKSRGSVKSQWRNSSGSSPSIQ